MDVQAFGHSAGVNMANNNRAIALGMTSTLECCNWSCTGV
jgi:hypothetical protein